jgi:hypothetical protein
LQGGGASGAMFVAALAEAREVLGERREAVAMRVEGDVCVDPPASAPAEQDATAYLPGSDDPARARRLAWFELLRRVWPEDGLRCGRGGGAMRVAAVIEDPGVIERIFKHVGLWQRRPPRGRRLVLDPTACA